MRGFGGSARGVVLRSRPHVVTEPYDPKRYWEGRLRDRFDLRGVGHLGFGAGYNGWLYRAKASRLERALAGVPLAGARVLDVGCGTGFFVAWYGARGAEVTGLDITEVSIERLSRRFRGTFRVQDVSAPDYEPGEPFAIVNMWDVVYHIVDDARFAQAMDNVARSVAPGGRFLLTDRFGAPADERTAEHVKFRCRATYEQVLAPHGLSLERLVPLYRWLNLPHLGRLDNLLGPLYYWLDRRDGRLAVDNLAVAVWRRDQPSP